MLCILGNTIRLEDFEGLPISALFTLNNSYEYLESFLQDQIDALEWTKKRFFIFLYLWFENWGTDDFDDALASRLLFFMRSSIGRAQADRIEFIWSEVCFVGLRKLLSLNYLSFFSFIVRQTA